MTTAAVFGALFAALYKDPIAGLRTGLLVFGILGVFYIAGFEPIFEITQWYWTEHSNAPAVGTILDGYRYMGGNPALPRSWEPV